MSADQNPRRILPQSSQMHDFSFQPAVNAVSRENQKNYVFVDEHNRHKRLKVMRACEGCRRRKIKCDAATTNTWPCSACIRLKLHCIPPTVNHDRDFSGGDQGFEGDEASFAGSNNEADYNTQIPIQSQQLPSLQKRSQQHMYSHPVQYADETGVYGHHYGASALEQQSLQFGQMQNSSTAVLDGNYQAQNLYTTTPLHPQQSSSVAHSSESPDSTAQYQEQYQMQDLADLLGDLKMDARGSAPYLKSKVHDSEPGDREEPVFEELDEYKNALPLVTSGPDMKIRIPAELMPDDETALHYFDLYFTNVHPYVPVLNKTRFYQQWHNDREAISPLILEAIFAIAGNLSDEPNQGQQWLALAGKHADSFLDVPRISTLQAMLIVLKARESTPKRGYYYRSWMTVVQCVAMAKDLGLDEHFEVHKSGAPCGSDLCSCVTKSRIWQTLFVCELMIGSPQVRTSMSVDVDSLDFSIPQAMPGDEMEYHVTRNFNYFVRIIRNVRKMHDVYSRIKKKKDWGLDPELSSLNPIFEAWLNDLPSDLQVVFPQDTSPPWLPSHFIGNLHSYYHLSIIMLHRPQLDPLDPTSMDGQWKQHMMICYDAAKRLCRLQEAILQYFGLPGLLCMQRGINFTIYCVLTCVLLHLVAITSPDPDLNADSREYFTRHMRILEKCTTPWPMPDMQQQIDSLREAFSADLSKPFSLKASFPYGSPGGPRQISPRIQQYHQSQLSRGPPIDHTGLEQHNSGHQQISYTGNPITPPISAGSVDSKGHSPGMQTQYIPANGQHVTQTLESTLPMAPPSTWNPARIFDQWNTTFGAPSAYKTQPSPPSAPLRLNTTSGPQLLNEIPQPQLGLNLPLPTGTQSMAPQQYTAASIPSYVSPSMWQESVASVYEGGLKRQWNYDPSVTMPLKRSR